MSSAWSAPMFFSSLFTRSSCFRRWSDSAPSRRICSSSGKKVPQLMPCARSTSGSGLPFRLPLGYRGSDSQYDAHSWSLEWLFTQEFSLKPLRVHVRRTRGNRARILRCISGGNTSQVERREVRRENERECASVLLARIVLKDRHY